MIEIKWVVITIVIYKKVRSWALALGARAKAQLQTNLFL
jgi:hypothetical protein